VDARGERHDGKGSAPGGWCRLALGNGAYVSTAQPEGCGRPHLHLLPRRALLATPSREDGEAKRGNDSADRSRFDQPK
jgi:hypothetical protein